VKFFKLKKEKRLFENYINIGVDFDQQRAVTNQRKQTYYINLDSTIDIMVFTRGILAGAIAVSISPSEYLTWTALLNGVFGGCLYVMALKLFHIFEYDDTTHISQCHGAISIYAMFSICLFHKTEGFFFKTMPETNTTIDL
jgi:ammonia channel protein AmtB